MHLSRFGWIVVISLLIWALLIVLFEVVFLTSRSSDWKKLYYHSITISTLLIISFLYSTTSEARYGYHHRYHHRSSHAPSGSNSDSRSVGVFIPSRMTLKPPLPWQYAIGNSVSEVLSASYPPMYEHLCPLPFVLNRP